eukprot:5423531-Pleurochrysis_carterae.AAC.3
MDLLLGPVSVFPNDAAGDDGGQAAVAGRFPDSARPSALQDNNVFVVEHYIPYWPEQLSISCTFVLSTISEARFRY